MAFPVKFKQICKCSVTICGFPWLWGFAQQIEKGEFTEKGMMTAINWQTVTRVYNCLVLKFCQVFVMGQRSKRVLLNFYYEILFLNFNRTILKPKNINCFNYSIKRLVAIPEFTIKSSSHLPPCTKKKIKMFNQKIWAIICQPAK